MSNKKETAALMYGFLFLILSDIIFLIFGKTFFHIENQLLYCIFILVLVFSVWRIIKLRIFYLEASSHVLSVKYYHPLRDKKKPVLEVPLHKVISLKIERKIMETKLNLNIKTRKGIRTFSYHIGTFAPGNNQSLETIEKLISDSKSTH